MYPEARSSREVSALRPALTLAGPIEYDRLVYEWPLRRLLIYLEQARLRAAFEDLDREMEDVLNQKR